MRLIKDHSGVRHDMLKNAYNGTDRALCFVADCIGVVVAEIRMEVIPRANKLLKKVPKNSIYSAGPQARIERSISVKLPTPLKTSNKKYTYEWAVARLQELEEIGVSDPVEYFNNEMADWWLAPGGMMEKEADFEEIARAIEERW